MFIIDLFRRTGSLWGFHRPAIIKMEVCMRKRQGRAGLFYLSTSALAAVKGWLSRKHWISCAEALGDSDIVFVGLNRAEGHWRKRLRECLGGIGRRRVIGICEGLTRPWVHELLDMGIAAIVTEPLMEHDIASAARAAASDTTYLSQPVSALMQISRPERREGGPERMRKLTYREREVLDLFNQRLQYKEIAERLQLSVSTVNNHLAKARQKEAPPKQNLWVSSGSGRRTRVIEGDFRGS
jgi:RNA polymerase sigma factor (sigma-70 family)